MLNEEEADNLPLNYFKINAVTSPHSKPTTYNPTFKIQHSKFKIKFHLTFNIK